MAARYMMPPRPLSPPRCKLDDLNINKGPASLLAGPLLFLGREAQETPIPIKSDTL